MFQNMRKILVLGLLALALVFGGCVKHVIPVKQPVVSTIFERMVNSVVVLPRCTGTVLKNDGLNSVILTAAHCVRRVMIEMPDKTYIQLPLLISADLDVKKVCFGEVGLISRERDLAIITVDKCPMPTFAAPLAKKEPSVGETVYAVGHPLSTSYLLTKGVVSRPRLLFGPQEFMFSSAPTIFGNSGGPFLNKKGEVVGILTNVALVSVRTRDGDHIPLYTAVSHLSMVVPLDDVKQFLKDAKFPDLVK
jgi:hypothetical protein